MRRWGMLAVGVGALVLAVLAPGAATQGGVPAEPVRAKPTGKGSQLWVFVHPADEERGGRKPKQPSCDDVNTQTSYLLFGKAKADGLAFNVNAASIPSSVATTAGGALGDAVAAWETVEPGQYFTLNSAGGASQPAQDGNNTIGWAFLVPRKALAAAWVWTDEATGRVLEADVFFNTQHPWAVFTSCPSGQGAYEVGNVAAHELGHTLALDHVSDAGKQATMYPSAPKDEVRKRTLTAGDAVGFQASLAG